MNETRKPIFLRGNWDEPLPPQIAFEAWLEMGSLNKAAKYLSDQGFKTKRGNPCTVATTHYAAWKYIFDRQEECKKYFDADYKVIGLDEQTDEEWAEYLIPKAMRFYQNRNPKHFQKWIEKNDFIKYCEIYKEKYPGIYKLHFEKVSA